MKILFLLMFLVSCNADPNKPAGRDSSDLAKYRDEQNSVTCYRVIGWEGISCVRDEQ